MDPTEQPSIAPTKSPSSNTVPIRLHKSTARLLRTLVTKCNRKSHGRKVKADDVIQKSLTLLQDSHLEEIKSSTYSSQDRLEIEFKKYCKEHGNISKDEFLKILLSKALPQVSSTPTQENL